MRKQDSTQSSEEPPSPPQRPPFPVTLAPGTVDALILEQAVRAQGRPSPEC